MINKICYWISRIAKDKILHFLCGYIITDYCLSLGEHFDFNIILTSVLSFVIASAFILGKEYIDKRKYNGWDWLDILAGYIGVIFKAIAFVIQVV